MVRRVFLVSKSKIAGSYSGGGIQTSQFIR
jgi:hypothetical protein